MHARRSFCSFLILLCSAVTLATPNSPQTKPFPCIGGSIYFSAHPVDSLLFQNPDLFHDLYVFKCVTTVIFTSGDRGIKGNFSLSLEHGLEEAYSWMAGLPMDVPSQKNASVRIKGYEIPSWSMRNMSNIQILYLRIPDGGPAGQGYDTHDGQSLVKLYKGDLKSITTTDGNATYTLDELKDLVSAILHTRQANDIRVLDHKASISHTQDTISDNTDHVISAKLVMDSMNQTKNGANITAYASAFIRELEPNLNASHPDYENKAAAFLKYANYDEQMCQSLEKCEDAVKTNDVNTSLDHDVRCVAQYLEREYYVS